ncbi:hypothetical protein [Methylovulum psychrotolerans]|uniref:hypothetical protein n=1 Tax=Methylovulum psychrotolerans TaxID=1704499 RepID=UPI0012F714E1|nr:hypothetical protein [Methylovulum psychrotolerans]MBT9098501.1 hypothetical protein [Methylovulum psychrotolerans]
MDKLRVYVPTTPAIEQQRDTLRNRVKEAESNYATGHVATGNIADLFKALDDESRVD